MLTMIEQPGSHRTDILLVQIDIIILVLDSLFNVDPKQQRLQKST
jgi:hypothetical protein